MIKYTLSTIFHIITCISFSNYTHNKLSKIKDSTFHTIILEYISLAVPRIIFKIKEQYCERILSLKNKISERMEMSSDVSKKLSPVNLLLLRLRSKFKQMNTVDKVYGEKT
jgi:hypothetical protein